MARIDAGGESRDVVVREDRDDRPGETSRWRTVGASDWMDWAGLHAEGQVEELVPRSEVDRLVAQAVADGGYEDIGDHRIALGTGWCVLHGEHYELPHELDRLRERAGEGL